MNASIKIRMRTSIKVSVNQWAYVDEFAGSLKSVGPIGKYQGGWQALAGYLPHVPNNQAEYGHQLVVMPKNDVHGQVGRLHLLVSGHTLMRY